MNIFHWEQFYLWLILQKTTHLLHKNRYKENYHFDQVFIFVHVLCRHAQDNIDDIEITNDDRYVIKEYHFYITDDCT